MTVASDLKRYLLANGPLDTTIANMAAIIGCSENTLSVTLNDIRKRADITGWTVPIQPRGAYQPRAWCVVETTSRLSRSDWDTLRTLHIHDLEFIERMAARRRVYTAILEQAVPTSTDAKAARAAIIGLDSAVAALQMASTIL